MARTPEPSEQLDMIIDRIRNAGDDPTALGACIFGGGFSFGVEEAGFRVGGHMELTDLDLGARTSMNRWPVVVAPLDGTYEEQGQYPRDPTTWRAAIDKIKKAEAVPDYLYMNPPCTAYAQQGKHRGMDDDVMCYTRYCAHVLAMGLEPKAWAWELVPGIFDDVSGGGRKFLEDMSSRAAALGYRCYAFLTTAANHGGYQNRKRFHFVASKVELDFEGVYDSEPDERRGWRTLGDALDVLARWEAANGDAPNHESDEKEIGGAMLGIMPYCPPGGYLRNLNDEIMRRYYKPRGKDWNGKSRAGVTQVRGRVDRPSPVIVGGATVIHPVKDRFLTIRENATVMGFPMDYRFSHGTKGYHEVGRGLCTHNASFLSRVVRAGIEAGRPVETNSGELEVVDWRGLASVPPMTPTVEDMESWWKEKHPDMPVELVKPRPKRKRGRPRGKRRKKKRSGPKRVLVSSLNDSDGVPKMIDMLSRMGFHAYGHPEGSDEDIAALMGAVGGSDLVLVKGKPDDVQFMIIGAALAKGTVVLVYALSEEDALPEHPSVHRTDASTPDKVVLAAGQAVGMDPQDILSKMLEGQDASALLQMLLKQAG